VERTAWSERRGAKNGVANSVERTAWSEKRRGEKRRGEKRGVNNGVVKNVENGDVVGEMGPLGVRTRERSLTRQTRG